MWLGILEGHKNWSETETPRSGSHFCLGLCSLLWTNGTVNGGSTEGPNAMTVSQCGKLEDVETPYFGVETQP